MVKAELDSSKDYYAVLGISYPSNQLSVRKAFLELARTQHPDKNPGKETEYKAKFQTITRAYDVLKDPATKKMYDLIRPIPKRTAPQPPAPARRFQASTSTQLPREAKPSPVPRQAKTAPRPVPKSSPKKAPTAARDLPGRPPANPTYKASPATDSWKGTFSSRDKPSSSTGQSSVPQFRKAPTAAHSAFFNASPRSPLNSSNSSASAPRHTASKNPFSGTAKQAPNDTISPQSDWTKDGWWGQSGTAYSTFHAPASKYSPYAGASPRDRPRDVPNPFVQSNPGRTRQPSAGPPSGKGDFTANSQSSRTATVETPSHEYNWQKSRSAYEGLATDPAGASTRDRPIKIPRSRLSANTKRSVPAESKSVGKNLDSDAIDDLSLSDSGSPLAKDPKGSRTGSDSISPTGSGSDSSAETSASDSESSSRDFPSHRQTKFQMESPALSSAKPAESLPKFRTAFTASNDGTPDSKPPGHVDSRTPSSAELKKFSFKFNTINSAGGNSASRRVSGHVPYVQFNGVPDLDFSTPTSQSIKGNLFSSGTSSSGCSATKKHDRSGELPDPRYESADQDLFAYQFSKLDLNRKAESPARGSRAKSTSMATKASSSDSNSKTPSRCGATDIKGQFTFSCDLPPSVTSSPLRPTNDEVGGNTSAMSDEPPTISLELLQPLCKHRESLDVVRQVYLTEYAARQVSYRKYAVAWAAYEDNFLAKRRDMDKTYLEALEQHTIRAKMHHQMEMDHLEEIKMWLS